jgi:hypothetical protein
MARDSLMRELGGMMLGQVRDVLHKRSSAPLRTPGDEPPVVAQLMIEIRSDGSRTIARGALNDLRTGESAKVHAQGRTPRDLILSLASSLLSLPAGFSEKLFRRGPLTQPELRADADQAAAVPTEGAASGRPR